MYLDSMSIFSPSLIPSSFDTGTSIKDEMRWFIYNPCIWFTKVYSSTIQILG